MFKRPISLRCVIESATLTDLAHAIDRTKTLKYEKTLGYRQDESRISQVELGWWKKYQTKQGTSSFNVTFASKLGPKIDCLRLAQAWNSVLHRHKLLRCRYTSLSNGDVIRVYTNTSAQAQQISYVDVWQEINRPFNLECDHPVRIIISRHHLVTVFNHIICDLTTLQVLLHEVAVCYNGDILPPVCRTYMQANSEEIYVPPCKIDFWASYLANLSLSTVCFGNLAQERMAYRGTSYSLRVPANTVSSLRTFVAQHRITLHQLSLAAVALALQFDERHTDIILGAPSFNRSCTEDLQTVSLFLEPIPIRIRYPHVWPMEIDSGSIAAPCVGSCLDNFLVFIRASSQAALSNAVPWSQLQPHLVVPNMNHIFDVMVTFHDGQAIPQLPLPSLEPLYVWTQGAKFKLMTEFMAINQQTLLLRLEYDEECLSPAEVDLVSGLIVDALQILADSWGYNAVKKELRTNVKRNIYAERTGTTGNCL